MFFNSVDSIVKFINLAIKRLDKLLEKKNKKYIKLTEDENRIFMQKREISDEVNRAKNVKAKLAAIIE